jgi:tetratricopeptide (TPR) repeat protein
MFRRVFKIVSQLNIYKFPIRQVNVASKTLFAGIFGFSLSSDTDITQTVKRGLLAQYQRKYDLAENLFHDAIKLYDKQKDEKKASIVKTNLYLYLANLYYEAKDWKRSFNLFQESLRDLIVNSKYESNSETIIEISLKMSNIFANEGRIHAAKVGYEFCQEAALSKLKEYELKKSTEESSNDLDSKLVNIKALYVITLQTFGRYLASLEEYGQAVTLLEQAKILAANLFNSEKEQELHNLKLSSLYNDLAIAYYGVENYEEALTLLAKSLEFIEEERQKIEIRGVARFNDEFDRIQYQQKKAEFIETNFTTLANLCTTQFALKQYDQAKSNCLKSIRLAKANLNVDLQQEVKEIEKTTKKIDEERNKKS